LCRSGGEHAAGGIAAFDGSIPASTQAKLMPTQSQLARYLPNANATATELAFANDLAFIANAFKRSPRRRSTE
jgi:hypothetical protein